MEQQLAELVIWEQVRQDCKYPKEDNNKVIKNYIQKKYILKQIIKMQNHYIWKSWTQGQNQTPCN